MRKKYRFPIRSGMTMLLLFLGMGLMGAREVQAQSVGIAPVTTLKSEKVLNIGISGFTYPSELSPFVLKDASGQRRYVLTSSWSWKCSSRDNFLNTNVSLDPARCNLVTRPVALDTLGPQGQISFKTILNKNTVTEDWNLTYNGLMGMQVVGDKIMGIRHEENQNSNVYGGIIQNTVFDWIPVNAAYTDTTGKEWPSGCAAGYFGGSYQACWDSFSNFISLAWSPYSKSAGWTGTQLMNDEGPIIWPSRGYAISQTKTKLGGGFYQPTFLANGDYLYVFYVNDNDLQYTELQCLSVARAPVSGEGKPGTWKTYYQGSFSQDALPAGFNKEHIRDFYGVGGGKADCVIKADNGGLNKSAMQYFWVAKVRGTPYFISAEESSPNLATWQMGVRLSTDLVHWSPLKVLATAPGSWGQGKYSYPTFVDRNASTNYEIDLGDFWIIGKHATGGAGYELNAMNLSLAITGYNPPLSLTDEQRAAGVTFGSFGGWYKAWVDHIGILADLKVLLSKL